MTLLVIILLAYAINAFMNFMSENGSGILMLLFELLLWLIKLPIRVAKTIRIYFCKMKKRNFVKAGRNVEEPALEEKDEMELKKMKKKMRKKRLFRIFLNSLSECRKS